MPGSLRMLLIDDNPDDRALVLRAMQREFKDIVSTEISNPRELDQALTSTTFDLAVTDYQLNWSTGLDLLPLIRGVKPDCPVIMFTSTGSEEIAVSALKAGMDDYILKSPKHFMILASSVRKLMERERNRERAEESETRLQELLIRLNVGVYRTGPQGEMLYANPAFLRIFGLSSWEEASRWRLDDYVANPNDLEHLREDMAKDGQVRLSELELRGSSEGVKWISLTLRSERGNEIEGLVEDVTERKHLDMALSAKDDELRQAHKLESIGRLAGGVAHDFNNLLTAINGYSDLLLEMLGEDSPLRENLLEIRKAGNRAATLTRELLAFSRRQMMRPQILDINQMILGMENLIRHSLNGNVRLETRLSPFLGKVKADPGQMETVIMNLVLNARDAMPEGGRLLMETDHAEIAAENTTGRKKKNRPKESLPPGSYIRLKVSDTGKGIDPEMRSRIFEPFFTTKPFGNGSGMGLATVYGIVKQSDGDIRVESQPGLGTCFSVYLPCVDSDAVEAPSGIPSRQLPQT